MKFLKLIIVTSFLILSTFTHAKDTSNAKMESELLLKFLLPKAEYFLKKNGEFYPLAATLNYKKEIITIATYNGNEFPKSTDLIQDLNQAFQLGGQNKEYKATGMIYDVKLTSIATGKKTDALVVALDHVDNYSILITLPYQLKNNEIIYQESFANEGDYKIFPATR